MMQSPFVAFVIFLIALIIVLILLKIVLGHLFPSLDSNMRDLIMAVVVLAWLVYGYNGHWRLW